MLYMLFKDYRLRETHLFYLSTTALAVSLVNNGDTLCYKPRQRALSVIGGIRALTFQGNFFCWNESFKTVVLRNLKSR